MFAAKVVGHKQSNLPIDHKILNEQSNNNKHMKRTEKGQHAHISAASANAGD